MDNEQMNTKTLQEVASVHTCYNHSHIFRTEMAIWRQLAGIHMFVLKVSSHNTFFCT